MSITYPYTLTNGTTADASQVQANFAAVNDVVAPVATSVAALLVDVAALEVPDVAIVRRVSTNFAVPNGTLTAVTYPTETLDRPGSQFTPVSPSLLTCVQAGTYVVTARVEWAPNVTGHRELRFVSTLGNELVDSRNAVTAPGFGTAQSASRVMQIAAAATVEVQVYQSSGGDLNIGNAEFSWSRIGD